MVIKMNRFRVTLIAVCIVLSWLAYKDISLFLRNPEPLIISITELEKMEKAPREWLTITGGYPQLLEGINMTGSMEFEAFLVPLTSSPNSNNFKVWFETRDPAILDALTTYHFLLNTESQRRIFLDEHAHIFAGQRYLTGMTAAELVANSNQRKLVNLLEQIGIETTEPPVFISESKQPAAWRGIFFALAAFAGLMKISWDWRTRVQAPQQ